MPGGRQGATVSLLAPAVAWPHTPSYTTPALAASAAVSYRSAVPGPDFLQGVTVLDFTRVLAGPYCTRLLADLGARVLKIERPRGDDMRVAPLQLDPERGDQSTYFVRVNAGKRSVGLDLGHPEGRAVALDLMRIADVVVENFRPGVMARMGLDYAAAAAIRPDLVYCSISGYGQTGPWRDRAALAHVVHATSGLMHLERGATEAPRVLYLQAADILAGTHAFGAIAAALLRRARTGRGAYLDVSMLEALIGAEDISFGSALNDGPTYPGPRSGMLVHQVGDSWVALQVVGVLDLWPRLLDLLARPDLAQDPRFATPSRPARELARAPSDHRGLARSLRLGRRRARRPERGAHPVRARALARRGGRGAAPRGARRPSRRSPIRPTARCA